jgi:two-component system, OmpR family, response regulator
MHLLLIEPDAALAVRLTVGLAASPHDVQWCTRVDQARQVRSFDAAVLDVDDATGPAMALLADWRRTGLRQPVAVVTAPAQSRSRACGHTLGADVGLIKPIGVHELLNWLDTAHPPHEPTRCLVRGGLTVDLSARSAQCNGATLKLTSLEWAVLMCLARRPGRIYSRREIESQLRQQGVLAAASNSVEVIVSRLRKKLGRAVISTHRDIGYRLDA